MTLDEIKLGETTANYEPALDYIVAKMPRFPFDKFATAANTLSTQMKATGEVMGIGRTLEECLLKSIRSLEIGVCHLYMPKFDTMSNEDMLSYIATSPDDRIYAIAQLIRNGVSLHEIFKATMITEYFLESFKKIVDYETTLAENVGNKEILTTAKKMGFSDQYIAKLWKQDEVAVYSLRKEMNLFPVYKMIETSGCGGYIPYFYSTYEKENDSRISDKKKIIVLGSGPIRIGQGVEFDYSTVHAVTTIKKFGYESIIINNNPETVSTDYTTSDKLYFEPLTVEDVMNVVELEQPLGVIASLGGQTAINLAEPLMKRGVTIIGTDVAAIEKAENRDSFEHIMTQLGIPQPKGQAVTNIEAGVKAAAEIGYPVLVRPSYVLGGRGMEVVYDPENLTKYMDAAVGVTPDRPILIDRFLNHAMECEADAISDGTHAFVPAVMEHIELAGVHSGDSACIIPSRHISEKNVKTIKEYTRKIAEEMGVKGLMNMQYAIENDKVYVLEANPRASRTVPLVSKVCNIRMVPLAIDIVTSELTGRPSPVPGLKEKNIPYYGVKESVFPFNMFQEVDPVLGPEMRSTGEVLGLSEFYGEAFFKAQEATQTKLPMSGTVLISVCDKDKAELPEVAKGFADAGFHILATKGTQKVLADAGIVSEFVYKLSEGRPNISDLITNGKIDLIINTPRGADGTLDDSYLRKAAIRKKIPYITTMAAAKATASGIESMNKPGCGVVRSLQELHSTITDKE